MQESSHGTFAPAVDAVLEDTIKAGEDVFFEAETIRWMEVEESFYFWDRQNINAPGHGSGEREALEMARLDAPYIIRVQNEPTAVVCGARSYFFNYQVAYFPHVTHHLGLDADPIFDPYISVSVNPSVKWE